MRMLIILSTLLLLGVISVINIRTRLMPLVTPPERYLGRVSSFGSLWFPSFKLTQSASSVIVWSIHAN
jgi:hypothetical protein